MKKTVKENFWSKKSFVSIGNRIEFTPTNSALMPILENLLQKDKGHVCQSEFEGSVKLNSKGIKKINAQIVKLGGRLLHKEISDYGNVSTYVWNDGMLQASISPSYISGSIVTENEKLVEEVKGLLETLWMPPEKTGHVYAIVRQGMNLGLNSIGNAGIPLVKDNYTDKVMADYQFAIKDLQTENPSGRIVIMKGPPGTGKTHLIRAMLLEVPDAMFVLISPEMITTLAGPELLPLLMNYRGGTTGPIVLILEDADKCLVTRAGDNMSSIQSLLNLGDGILGSLLDLRIVATTNADELKMEAAILRPGRLSKMVDVAGLDLKTAKQVYARLLPNATLPSDLKPNNAVDSAKFEMSLAEVYSLARKNGWLPENRKMEDKNQEDVKDSVEYD